jgi:Co/Zn/Cd efflux system component
MAGLALITLGKLILPDVKMEWLDPVAAICVALLIIKAAWDLTIESGKEHSRWSAIGKSRPADSKLLNKRRFRVKINR